MYIETYHRIFGYNMVNVRNLCLDFSLHDLSGSKDETSEIGYGYRYLRNVAW